MRDEVLLFANKTCRLGLYSKDNKWGFQGSPGAMYATTVDTMARFLSPGNGRKWLKSVPLMVASVILAYVLPLGFEQLNVDMYGDVRSKHNKTVFGISVVVLMAVSASRKIAFLWPPEWVHEVARWLKVFKNCFLLAKIYIKQVDLCSLASKSHHHTMSNSDVFKEAYVQAPKQRLLASIGSLVDIAMELSSSTSLANIEQQASSLRSNRTVFLNSEYV